MSDTRAAAAHRAKLVQVRRLAAALAARVRYAQTVADAQVDALVGAARLLRAEGEPWPPLVDEALRACAGEIAGEGTEDGSGAPSPDAAEPRSGGASGLMRLLGIRRGAHGRGRVADA